MSACVFSGTNRLGKANTLESLIPVYGNYMLMHFEINSNSHYIHTERSWDLITLSSVPQCKIFFCMNSAISCRTAFDCSGTVHDAALQQQNCCWVSGQNQSWTDRPLEEVQNFSLPASLKNVCLTSALPTSYKLTMPEGQKSGSILNKGGCEQSTITTKQLWEIIQSSRIVRLIKTWAIYLNWQNNEGRWASVLIQDFSQPVSTI